MAMHFNKLVGVAALLMSGATMAQEQPAQQTTATTTQQSPSETQTPTTNSMTGQPAGPSQSSTTTATTTTNAGAAQAATAADVKAGVSVYDQNGGLVGKVESVSSKGAVINTGTVKAAIPVSSFAKNDKGLVIAMNKAEIDAAAKKSAAKPK